MHFQFIFNILKDNLVDFNGLSFFLLLSYQFLDEYLTFMELKYPCVMYIS